MNAHGQKIAVHLLTKKHVSNIHASAVLVGGLARKVPSTTAVLLDLAYDANLSLHIREQVTFLAVVLNHVLALMYTQL